MPCPPLLHDYNKYMCGSGRGYQNNGYYGVGQKCEHWPPRVVFHQLETSINNAFLIYKATQAGMILTSKEFRMILATHLMSGYVTKAKHPCWEEKSKCKSGTKVAKCWPSHSSCWPFKSLYCLFYSFVLSIQK